MKRLLLKVSLLCLLIAAYVASPFATAWNIREAVRNGNAAYLHTAIDWPSVRETLKPTLSRLALNMPLEGEEHAGNKPGLWQRMKAYWGQGAVNRAIDSYVTPEGLPQLFALRKNYRDVTGAVDDSKTLPLTERMTRAWARVKRAEFTSFTTFEMDMADKQDESRLYLGKLELTGMGWKLKELRIKSLGSDAIESNDAPSAPASPAAAQNFLDADASAAEDPAAGSKMLTQRAKPRWSTAFIGRAEASPYGPVENVKPSLWQRAKAFARGEKIRGDR